MKTLVSTHLLPRHCWLVVGTLAACLILPISAFQQSTYFLIDVQEDTEKSSSTGRIVVAASVFEAAAATLRAQATEQRQRSEFETGISVFGTQSSDRSSDLIGGDLLQIENDDSSSKSRFGEETPAAPTGFFFTD